MPRTCTICSHDQRKAIEKQLAQGVALRHIASKFSVGYKAVERHQSCIAVSLDKAKEKREVEHGATIAEQLGKLQGQTEQILDMFMGYLSPINGELALKAIDRRHKQLEIAAKLAGEFKQDAPNPVTLENLVKTAAAELVKDAETEGVEMTPEQAAELVRPHIESQMAH